MATTVDDVRAVAPELSTVQDSTIELFIGEATGDLNPRYFRDKLDRAIKYLAAHMSYTNSGISKDVTGSEISSKKVGDLAVSYKTSSKGENPLMATRWGKEYLRIRRSCSTGPILSDQNTDIVGAT